MQKENAIGVFYLSLTALCWGFVAVTVKQLTATVDPYTISFYRVFMATIIFVALYAIRKHDWRKVQWLLPWIIWGALGRAGNYLFYNAGLVHAPASAATILAPVQTISLILLAWWFIGEGIRAKWFGLMLSLLGMALIWWNGQGLAILTDPQYAWNNGLLILAGVASAVQFCSQKILSIKLSGLEILLPVFALSTLVTTPFAWTAGGFDQSYSPTTWSLLLFLGIILTGASFLFLAEGYKRCDATTSVVITNTGIFFTLIWSVVLLKEAVSISMVVGAVLAVIGAVAIVHVDRQAIAKRQQDLMRVS